MEQRKAIARYYLLNSTTFLTSANMHAAHSRIQARKRYKPV